MKRAFVITPDFQLHSEIVADDTPDVLRVGDRITASRALAVGYGALIQPGEHGTIDHIDEPTGTVDILMDLFHRGLDEWHNHIWLEPFATEDILGGISVLCLASLIFTKVA